MSIDLQKGRPDCAPSQGEARQVLPGPLGKVGLHDLERYNHVVLVQYCTITKCLNNYVLIYILNGSLVSKLPSCGHMSVGGFLACQPYR